MPEIYPTPNSGAAYAQGGADEKAGKSFSSNPHPRHSHEWEQWRLGWLRHMVVTNERLLQQRRK